MDAWAADELEVPAALVERYPVTQASPGQSPRDHLMGMYLLAGTGDEQVAGELEAEIFIELALEALASWLVARVTFDRQVDERPWSIDGVIGARAARQLLDTAWLGQDAS